MLVALVSWRTVRQDGSDEPSQPCWLHRVLTSQLGSDMFFAMVQEATLEGGNSGQSEEASN